MAVLELTDATFNQNVSVVGSGVNLVYFHAAWCGPCKLLGPRYAALAERTTNASFFKADCADCTKTCNTLGVRSLPTLMAFKDTAVIGVLQGNVSDKDITNLIETAIKA